MPVGLAQMVLGISVFQERCEALFPFRDDDGVKQDGRSAGQGSVNRQIFPFFRCYASHVRGNDLGVDAFFMQGLADFFHGFQADAVRCQ